MTNYIITTDCACDLPLSIAEELGLVVLPLTLNIDDKSYACNLNEGEISAKKFYAMMREGKIASTSAINAATTMQFLEPLLQEGYDILHLAFSSGLSSTYNSTVAAVQELRERYPQRKIYSLDTLCASLGQGLLVYLAAQKRLAGCSIEEVVDYVEEIKLNICHWFTVDDLSYLRRGGRLSAASAVVGTVLNVKPVLHANDEGRLENVCKVRGRKKSLQALYKELENSAIDISEQTVFISHGDCLEDAELLAAMIKDNLGAKQVIINYIGPVIGVHSGPGTVALFFVGEKR